MIKRFRYNSPGRLLATIVTGCRRPEDEKSASRPFQFGFDRNHPISYLFFSVSGWWDTITGFHFHPGISGQRRRSGEREENSAVTLRLTTWAMALLLALTAVLSPGANSGGIPPGRKSLDTTGSMHVSPEDRCPVCGMRVMNDPYFSTAIQLKDDTTFYFCSAGCMIRAWLQPEIFLAHPKHRIRRAMVKNYFTGQPLDALKAFWVAGSDVIDPMGPAVVPLSGTEEVRIFRRRHGGNQVFRLQELDSDRWRSITGDNASGNQP
jgi:nitrous oxide reductase accessory protein NosL